MLSSSPAWRIALFVMVVAGFLWLGGIHIRAVIGNDLLQLGTLRFEEYISPDAEREVYRLLSFVSLIVICSYVVVLISTIVFLATSPFKLKEHGWLLMSAILFYVFVPVESFTIFLDAKMIYQEFFTTADNQVFRELFIARVAALAGTPLIALLCYYTIIGLVIFQPLRKIQPHIR